MEVEEYAFNEYIDRCLLDAVVANMLDQYEEKEERQIHTKQLTDKKKRVTTITYIF